MKDNILKETAITPMQELCCVQRNANSNCEARYKAGCQHFGPVLQKTVRWTARVIRTPKFPADAGFAAGQLKRKVPRAGTCVLTVPPNPYSIHAPCAKNA